LWGFKLGWRAFRGLRDSGEVLKKKNVVLGFEDDEGTAEALEIARGPVMKLLLGVNVGTFDAADEASKKVRMLEDTDEAFPYGLAVKASWEGNFEATAVNLTAFLPVEEDNQCSNPPPCSQYFPDAPVEFFVKFSTSHFPITLRTLGLVFAMKPPN